jgi:hypothetical protein
MGDQATPASTDQTRPRSVVDRDVARVLALPENDHAGGLTIADLGERGVWVSAQTVYMLRLASRDIDRVDCEHRDRPATRRGLGTQDCGELIATDVENCRCFGRARRL